MCQLGIPLVVQSDKGTHFTALFFKETCRTSGIKHKLSSANYSQSQGQVERQNQLVSTFRCVIDVEPYS